MPNSDTFDVPEIAGFVKKYLMKSKCSIDPFARNKRWATHTNDLNPNTAATHHMDALDFLKKMAAEGVRPDLIIFDPPYAVHQVKECYEGIGVKFMQSDVYRTAGWTNERRVMNEMLTPAGIVLSFGWNTIGMGGKGYDILEGLVVCHGACHNDTLCMAEMKREPEATLWTQNDQAERPG